MFRRIRLLCMAPWAAVWLIGCGQVEPRPEVSSNDARPPGLTRDWHSRVEGLHRSAMEAPTRGDSLKRSLARLRAIEEVWPDSALRLAAHIADAAKANGMKAESCEAHMIGATISARMLMADARQRVHDATIDALLLLPGSADDARSRCVRAAIQFQDSTILKDAPGWNVAHGHGIEAARALLAALLADTALFVRSHRETRTVLAGDTAPSELRARIILDMADAFDRRSMPDSALHWVKMADHEATRAGSPYLLDQALHLRTYIEVNTGRYAAAGDHALQARDLLQQLNARWHLSETER